jgi:hypothetical protein
MKPISSYTNADDLRRLMANAKRLKSEDTCDKAFLRLCEVEGMNYSDPLERDFYATLTAYEELLAEKHGRKQPAARTRQKLKNKGFIACLEDWATGEKRTEGFETLVRMGHIELTGEYLVTKYPERFSARAVSKATFLMELFKENPIGGSALEHDDTESSDS